MCLAAIAWGRSSRFPLVVASNRDEFFERPTADMAWWSHRPGQALVLAGRDLRAGGTWLGLSAAGRLALVTNVRRAEPAETDAASAWERPSRGELVPAWLSGQLGTEDFCSDAARAGHRLYNLILGDFAAGALVWTSSEQPRPIDLATGPGLVGLSNAQLDTPWPKVRHLKQQLADAIGVADAELAGATGATEAGEALAQRLFTALADPTPAADTDLPDTGVGLARERWLSPAFIRSPDGRYGTRCSTVLICERSTDGRLQSRIIERRHDLAGIPKVTWDSVLPDWPPTGLPALLRKP